MNPSNEPARIAHRRGTAMTMIGGAVLVAAGCGGSSVDLAESAVCDGGVPGDLAVAPSPDGSGGRLFAICWQDTTHADPGRIAVYETSDDGTALSPSASYPVGRQASDLTVTDLDGDGIADLLAANTGGLSEDHHVSFLKGNDDGSYEDARRLPAVRSGFVVNDIDGDGRNDLVIPDETAALVAQTSVGDMDADADLTGTFRRGRLPGVETQSRSGDVARGLNGHDRLAVVLDREGGLVHVYAEGGEGKTDITLPAEAPSIHSVLAVADLNADERPDLVASVQTADDPLVHTVHLVLSTADGAWAVSEIDGVSSAPSAEMALAADGDGTAHGFLAARDNTDGSDSELAHFTINADGEATVESTIAVPHFPYSMAVADLDGDDTDAVIIRDMDGQRLSWFSMEAFSES